MPSAVRRLKRRSEFIRVAAAGAPVRTHGVLLQIRRRQDFAPARLGFTVTRKVGNAVIRNRSRRRLKEAARLLLRNHNITGCDLVLVGRDATRSRDFLDLMDDLRRALRRSGFEI